jgi:spermidine/putrescine transport system permease protein
VIAGLRRRGGLLPYLLLAPGLAWLLVFFAVPALTQLYVSLQERRIDEASLQITYVFDWNVATYTDAIADYADQFGRSLWYAALATVAAFVISFPLAYFIAFKAGRWKNVMLLLIVLPFFTSYLVRTVAWQTILEDDGVVVDVLQAVGVLGEDGRLLATTVAVVAGITYNFLPFMALPLYVSLERIDRRLIEAATDLYASRVAAFRRVTLPLAVPGIFAGSLLTFIPAVGDFVNAQLLGTSRQYMIGNVIQSKFLVNTDYPTAAGLSFLLMALLLVAVLVYAKVLGARNLQEAAV